VERTPGQSISGWTADQSAGIANGMSRRTVFVDHFSACVLEIAQLVAHHTVNGCDWRRRSARNRHSVGATPGEAGSLLELSRRSRPIQISRDESRTFLEDGDKCHFPRMVRKTWLARIVLAMHKAACCPPPIFRLQSTRLSDFLLHDRKGNLCRHLRFTLKARQSRSPMTILITILLLLSSAWR